MTIDQDKAKFFWLAANDAVDPANGFPEPPSFDNSKITPLIDMEEYVAEIKLALAEVGKSATASDNAGDFIYIANWWLGLNGGTTAIPKTVADLANGPTVTPAANSPPFAMDPTNLVATELRNILIDKQKRGVDVRVLGWVSFALFSTTPASMLSVPKNQALALRLMAAASSIVNVNAETIDAIHTLRNASTPIPQTMLNVMGHSAGAAHVKCAIIGKKNGANAKAVGFTGGLDWESSRWARLDHIPDASWKTRKLDPFWHDVQAKVEGPATQGLYDFYKVLWDDNVKAKVKTFNVNGKTVAHRTSVVKHVPGKTIDAPLMAGVTGLTHSVQSARTVPAANYAVINQFPEGTASKFGKGGLFEIRAVWKKAIENAETYIYIEDQSFWSIEIMEWIRERLRTTAALRAILIMPGAGDPNDGDANAGDMLFESFNNGLLGTGTANPLPQTAIDRVRVFQLWGDMLPDIPVTVDTVDTTNAAFNLVTTTRVLTGALGKNVLHRIRQFANMGGSSWKITGNPAIATGGKLAFHITKAPAAPASGNALDLRGAYGLTVHSKTTIIDDKWAIIGSANHARRSLYTDWEHSVSFLDTGDAVKEYRKKLWNEHFNSPGVAQFDPLDASIAAWDQNDPTWNTLAGPVAMPALPSRPAGNLAPNFIEPVTLPLPAPKPPLAIPIPTTRRTRIDKIDDPDSRKSWGGIKGP